MIYECHCLICGRKKEIIRKMKDRNDTPVCCGQKMHRIISAPYVGVVDFITSDITGKPVHITSHKQHDKLCKEHNVAPVGIKGEF